MPYQPSRALSKQGGKFQTLNTVLEFGRATPAFCCVCNRLAACGGRITYSKRASGCDGPILKLPRKWSTPVALEARDPKGQTPLNTGIQAPAEPKAKASNNPITPGALNP